eukprot:scaffold8919_cov98-Isochrysis_galbana.AAC.4
MPDVSARTASYLQLTRHPCPHPTPTVSPYIADVVRPMMLLPSWKTTRTFCSAPRRNAPTVSISTSARSALGGGS